MLGIEERATELGMVNGSPLKGSVRIKVLDADRNVIEDKEVSNNIVVGIRRPIIKLLAGYNAEVATLPFITTLKLGDCMVDDELVTDDVSPNDSSLFHYIEGSSKNTATNPVISDDGYRVTFAFLYAASDTAINYSSTNEVVIREMGLFANMGENLTMVAHTKVGEWKKTAGVFFEVYWTIGYSVQELTNS